MPPLVLTIEVDDKGSPVLRSFAATAQQVGEQLGTGVQQGAARAASSVEGFTASLGNAILKGAGLATGFAGLHGIEAGFRAVVGAQLDFQTALANTNTLIPGQTRLQQQLREEILRLPPALGSSTDLAKGLYAVLSAGIKPTEAVQFLGTSAELARAGLGSLDTATTALTKTLQVYGLQTSDASRVSDVLFQTVNVGQGTLEQFAGAFPNVLVVAKSLGVSFQDASAALATLSNAFKSPQEAATGLRSLLAQLTAQSDEFVTRGVNIRQVIQEKGLLGALDALRTLTQGNADALRQFIPDIEGQQAALTLLGAQYEKFIDVQKQLANSQGSVTKAVAEQNNTIAAGLREVGGELSLYLQKFVDVTAKALGANGGFLAATAGLLKQARESLEVRRTQFEAEQAFEEALTRTTVAVGTHTTALINQFGQLNQNIQVTQAFAKALDQERADTRASEAAIKSFGEKSQAQLEQLAQAAELNFAQIFEHGKETPQNLLALWEKTAKAIIAAYGTLPPGLRLLDEELRTQAAQTPVQIEEAYKRLGTNTTAELQRLAERSLEAFQKILADGKTTPDELLKTWQQVLKQLSDAGFKTLPPAFASVNTQMQETARRAGAELPKPYLDAFGQIKIGARGLATAFDAAFKDIEAALGQSGTSVKELANGLTDAQISAARDLGLISQAAADTALTIRKAGQEGGKGFAEGIKQATEDSRTSLDRFGEQVDLLNIKLATINIPFSTDVDVLKKQLETAKRDLADLLTGLSDLNHGPVGLTTGAFDDAVIKAKRKQIEDLQAKIDELLGKNGSGSATVAAGGLGGGTGTTPLTLLTGGGAFGGSSRPGSPGVPLSPILSPAPFPLQGVPVSLPIAPLDYLPGPYTPTPLPARTAPAASPGGTFSIPQVTGNGGGPLTLPGQPQFLGVTAPTVDTPVVGATRGITVNVHVAAITRGGAQDLADHLAPALRELQRQGRL